MSGKEAGHRLVQNAIHLDESTPLGMKLSVLVAIVTFAVAATYAVATWKASTDSRGEANSNAISDVGLDVKEIGAKVDNLTGSVSQLRDDVRDMLIIQRSRTATMSAPTPPLDRVVVQHGK